MYKNIRNNIRNTEKHIKLENKIYLEYNKKASMWDVLEQFEGTTRVVARVRSLYEANQCIRDMFVN